MPKVFQKDIFERSLQFIFQTILKILLLKDGAKNAHSFGVKHTLQGAYTYCIARAWTRN